MALAPAAVSATGKARVPAWIPHPLPISWVITGIALREARGACAVNAAIAVNPSGEIVAVHRKQRLFCAPIPRFPSSSRPMTNSRAV